MPAESCRDLKSRNMFGMGHSILSRIRSRFTSTTCAGRSTTNIPPSLSILVAAKDIFSGRAGKAVPRISRLTFAHALSLWERVGVRAWRWNTTTLFFFIRVEEQGRMVFFPVALCPHPTLSQGERGSLPENARLTGLKKYLP